ncbi:translation initiation factor IF-2 [Candidatus Hepatincola sp. Pdp]
MNEKNDSKKEEVKTVRKKLSLTGAPLDINKILASKAAGKGKVQIIGDVKPAPKPEVATKPRKTTEDNVPDSASTNKLTDEEQTRRSNAVKAALNQEKTPAKQVHQSSPKEVNDSVKENLVDNFTPPAPTESRAKHGHGKEKYDESDKDKFEESLPAKKKKSHLFADVEKRKSNVVKNWRNVTIDKIDELDSELEENLEVAENIQTYKYTPPVRRKNKYNKLLKTKVYKEVTLSGDISVKSLARLMAEKTITVIKALEKLGEIKTENDLLDVASAELVVNALGHSAKILETLPPDYKYLHFNDDEVELSPKPPVVTIMGHVDHGKTTLLDTIRKSNVAKGESGGITQHLGAYQVKVNGQFITFLDTPGHQAFTQIRARGSKVTDIVIIVIAADDSIKPQTLEAFSHAQSAGVPMIIAINKVDKEGVDPQKVKIELLQHNIVVEEMGGEILCVEISAKQNLGIDKLLETILLQAEMLDLKTNISALGKASVVEVKQEKGLGYLATVLVERGTLKVGDNFVTGLQYGKIKSMRDDSGNLIKEAFPCMPVGIAGFASTVEAGDDFFVVESEAIANEIVNYRKSLVVIEREKSLSIVDILQSQTEVTVFAMVVKADTQGSLEAIANSLEKIQHPELEIKVIHSAIGEITESDIMLAKSVKGAIFGFNTRANKKAKELAEQEGVTIRYHSIIYNLIDDVKLILSGLLDPDVVENIIGYAEVREVFNITKVGNIAGCFVTEGTLKRSANVRLLRDNVVIHDGVLSTLKRFKDDVKEVKQSFECGVAFENYNDIKVKDVIECYEKQEVKKVVT